MHTNDSYSKFYSRNKSDLMLTTLATERMSTPVVTITVEKPVSAAARIMLDNHGGSLVVVDENGYFVGLISESKYLP